MKLVDVTTGTVLMEHNADERMPPSSMSKLMTLYVLFQKLKEGGITLESTLPVSETAWRMGGSKMFVQVGTEVKIEDLIRGIVVQSGNDACVVVAEGLGGTEQGFADMLNEWGQKIGLKDSHFVNSTGWPDPEHYMTSSDLVTLSKHLIEDFPEYYHYFGEAEFTYNGITQPNRNLLLAKDLGVDGLKTGHTEAAGFGIALSAEKEGRRLVLVVNGLSSMAERKTEGESLLRYGFREYEAVDVLSAGTALPNKLPVWFGAQEEVGLSVAEDFKVSLPRGSRDKLRFIVKTQAPVPAPIEAGAPLGTIEVYQGDALLRTAPLIATDAVGKAGFVDHATKALKHMIGS
jgi:D-alanyl-D-alanine carboxypeptidase (penicillin-binding protein 5/6)